MNNRFLYGQPPLFTNKAIDNAVINGYEVDKKVKAMFMSVNNTDDLTFTNASTYQEYAMANTSDSVLTAIKDCSVAVLEPLEPSDQKNTLKPLNDFQTILYNRDIVIKDVLFYGIWKTSKGGAGFTANQVNQAFIDSLNNENAGFNQGAFEYVALPTGQPNWFRPKILCNGESIIPNLDTTALISVDGNLTDHKGHYGIGMPLPYAEEIEKVIKHFNDLSVSAQAYIPLTISGTKVYQRIPLFCVMNIYTLKTIS